MKYNKRSLSLNKEWDFVSKEVISSNKGGTKKGEMLFEFQILLAALQRSRNLKERNFLSEFYQNKKKIFKNLIEKLCVP